MGDPGLASHGLAAAGGKDQAVFVINGVLSHRAPAANWKEGHAGKSNDIVTLVILGKLFHFISENTNGAAVVTLHPQRTDTRGGARLFPTNPSLVSHRPPRSLRAEVPPRRQGALRHRLAAGGVARCRARRCGAAPRRRRRRR